MQKDHRSPIEKRVVGSAEILERAIGPVAHILHLHLQVDGFRVVHADEDIYPVLLFIDTFTMSETRNQGQIPIASITVA